MSGGLDKELEEQVRYYRVRAPEYDAWADRDGAFDRGPRNDGWHLEKQRLRAALEDFGPTGAILEIAGGTGQWSRYLVRHARSLTIIDAASEALARNRARLADDVDRVQFVNADFFSWTPARAYDVVFFSYWLSHVPPELFATFWERVAACLAPGGRVFLIDNIDTEHASALDPEIASGDGVSVLRPAPDGRHYRVWKVLWRPDDLRAALEALGWTFRVYPTGTYFMWAEGERTPDR
jgi:SAM-dependent methyltransferase